MRVSIRQLEEDLSAARRRSDLYEAELKESRQTSEELKRKAGDYQHRMQKVYTVTKPVNDPERYIGRSYGLFDTYSVFCIGVGLRITQCNNVIRSYLTHL